MRRVTLDAWYVAHLHTRRRAQLRCMFTGRYMLAWVPVTHGPAWTLSLDRSLAPEVTS